MWVATVHPIHIRYPLGSRAFMIILKTLEVGEP